MGEESVLRQFLNGREKFNEGDVIASGRPNVTVRPNLPDIVRFRPYHPHGFILGDHTWPQNASDKSWTSTTNNVSYQILTRWCGILQFTPLKEPDDPVGTTGQPVRPVLIPNVTTRPNLPDIVRLGPYRPHKFVLGDHTWPQNASEKSTTSNTNKVSYQILTRRCEILHQVNPSLEELMYFLRVRGLWPPWWRHETLEPLTRERSNLIVGDSKSSLKIILGLRACLESCVSFLGFI
jgi:hypothetical protein